MKMDEAMAEEAMKMTTEHCKEQAGHDGNGSHDDEVTTPGGPQRLRTARLSCRP